MDWFSPIDPSKKNSEFIAVESKSFWKAAWGRFKKNPMAVLGLVVILLLAAVESLNMTSGAGCPFLKGVY